MNRSVRIQERCDTTKRWRRQRREALVTSGRSIRQIDRLEHAGDRRIFQGLRGTSVQTRTSYTEIAMTKPPSLFDDAAPESSDPASPSAISALTSSNQQPTAPVAEISVDATEPGVRYEPARMAKTAAVRKFADSMVACGVPLPVAEAQARAVVDPTAARAQMKVPTRKRILGGELLTVETTVYAAAVVPFMTNHRAAVKRRFPVAGEQYAGSPAVFKIGSRSDENHAVLTTVPVTIPDLSEMLGRNAAHIVSTNDYYSSIGEHGVSMPVTLASLEINHTDGTPPITVLTAVDGSSRVTACHKLLGMEPHQCVYPFGQSSTHLREHLQRLIQAASSSPTLQQIKALNAVEIPAVIVVGFRPAEKGLDFATAVQRYIALIHVDPPTPWEPTGVLDARADNVIDLLASTPEFPAREIKWIAGELPPAEAAAQGLSSQPDQRFAYIMHTILQPDVKRVVNQGITQLTTKVKQPDQDDRAAIAVELALRSVRASLNDDRLRSMRSALGKLVNTTGMFRKFISAPEAWHPTDRTPDELLTAALGELQTHSVAARYELALQGAWWLARGGVLTRPSTYAGEAYEPNVILQQLTATEHGLRTLHRALIDGRAGIDIAAVDSSGTALITARGKIQPLDRAKLTAQLPNDDELDDVAAAAEATAANAAPPEQLLQERLNRIPALVSALSQQVQSAQDIMAEGRSLLDAQGIDEEFAASVRNDLKKVDDEFVILARVGAIYRTAFHNQALRGE